VVIKEEQLKKTSGKGNSTTKVLKKIVKRSLTIPFRQSLVISLRSLLFLFLTSSSKSLKVTLTFEKVKLKVSKN
jgi:hypothetical protein